MSAVKFSSLQVPKTPGVYRLDFPNGYFYIGQSVNLRRRWVEHRSSFKSAFLKKTQPKLFNIWSKYGDPLHKVLVQCEVSQLDVIEQFYIDRHWTDLKLCNTNPSARSTRGRPSSRKGSVMREESRQKILGTSHGMSKLTEVQVREIRQLHVPRKRGYSARALAKKYGVSHLVIRNVAAYKSYTNVI